MSSYYVGELVLNQLATAFVTPYDIPPQAWVNEMLFGLRGRKYDETEAFHDIACARHEDPDEQAAELVKQILAAANNAGQRERYNEDPVPVQPWVRTDTPQDSRNAWLQVHDLCTTYVYQTCSWSGWHGSAAQEIINRIAQIAALRHLDSIRPEMASMIQPKKLGHLEI